jgi:hypothetical protein
VLVDGVGDPVEGLGGVLPGWQHADVVDHYEVAAAGPGHGPADLGPGDRGGGGLEGEPGDAQVLLDRGVGQGLDQVRLACPGGAGLMNAINRDRCRLSQDFALSPQGRLCLHRQ